MQGLEGGVLLLEEVFELDEEFGYWFISVLVLDVEVDVLQCLLEPL